MNYFSLDTTRNLCKDSIKNKHFYVAIILNYCRTDLTFKCIESLAGQVDAAVIVDNSADISEFNRLCKTLAHKLDKTDRPAVEILNPESNLGFAGGVNFALKHLKQSKKYTAVLIINNDCILPAGTVKILAEALSHCGNKAMVSPYMTEHGEAVLFWYQRATGILTTRQIPGSFPFLTGACILIPWEIASPRLFDPDFFMYGEDAELGWRMHLSHIPLVTVKEAKVDHLGSASAPHGSLFYEYHVNRGHILLAKKLAKNNFERFFFVVGRMIFLGLRAIVRGIRHKNIIPVKTFITAWIGITPCPPPIRKARPS